MKWILVAFQFGSLAYLSVSAPLLPPGWSYGLIMLLGLLLGAWSVQTMTLSNLRIPPDLKKNARLVTAGPYRRLRHPMYTALLLLFVPLVVAWPAWDRVLALVLLLLALLSKMKIEEKGLVNRFPSYTHYQEKSWRLIPFIW